MISWRAATDAQRTRVTRVESEHTTVLRRYADELLTFNRRHNLVSAAAEEHVYQHHVRHCLVLNCFAFPDGAAIVDWGSGGGLPAVPLAISNPGIHVIAVDKVGKKMQAVSAMARRLSVRNLGVFHGRAEKWQGAAAYSVSRATAPLSSLWSWHKNMLLNNQTEDVGATESTWPAGLICLKGGNLESEVEQLLEYDPNVSVSGYSIPDLLLTDSGDTYFDGKSLLLIQQT